MAQFLAQVKQVASKNLVSGDKSVRVVLDTQDLGALGVAEIPADSNVRVTIEKE